MSAKSSPRHPCAWKFSITGDAQAAFILGGDGCKAQDWSCQVANHLILLLVVHRVLLQLRFQLPAESDDVWSSHRRVLSLKWPLPLPQPHCNFSFFFLFVCEGCVGGWSGTEEKVETVQEVWITNSSFPWTKYSTFPERRQRLCFRAGTAHFQKSTQFPRIAFNCWAAAAGTTLTWLAGLWPAVFQWRQPSWYVSLWQWGTCWVTSHRPVLSGFLPHSACSAPSSS